MVILNNIIVIYKFLILKIVHHPTGNIFFSMPVENYKPSVFSIKESNCILLIIPYFTILRFNFFRRWILDKFGKISGEFFVIFFVLFRPGFTCFAISDYCSVW